MMEMKKYKLENLCTKITDGSHYSPVAVESGYPMFSVKDMEEFGFSYTDVKLISEDDFQKMCENDCVPQKNDVLVAKDGSYLKEAFVCMETKKEAILSSIAIFRPNIKLVNPYYLAYLFKTPNVYNYVTNGCVSGTALPRIVLKAFKQIEVFIPSLKQQNNVVSVLSSLDDKIAFNKKINTKLEAMVKRLYDYWFVQFDYPDKNGKPYKTSGGKMVWNEVLKREIPEGWEVGGLSDIANITMGQSPEGSSYNECGKGTIFYQGSTDFGIRFPSVRMYTTAPTRFAKKGDILMSVRAPVGAVNIANTDCCIGRGLSALNSKLGSMTHLYYVIDNFRHTFENKNVAGTTFGSITKNELFELPVAIPDSNVLKQFEFVIKQIFDKQMNIGFEIQKLTNLRDRLLPLLMNGQVEVE